jgi:hypothetical protein
MAATHGERSPRAPIRRGCDRVAVDRDDHRPRLTVVNASRRSRRCSHACGHRAGLTRSPTIGQDAQDLVFGHADATIAGPPLQSRRQLRHLDQPSNARRVCDHGSCVPPAVERDYHAAPPEIEREAAARRRGHGFAAGIICATRAPAQAWLRCHAHRNAFRRQLERAANSAQKALHA